MTDQLKTDKDNNRQSFAGLSPRLSVIAGMVRRGSAVADVGTDHAHLPAVLVREGICTHAVASDVSPNAAGRARDYIRDAGLDDRIEVHVRDGLAGYRPGDADILIISGIGGPLMIRILSASEEMCRSFNEMILSPQSEVAEVRRWLLEHDFTLSDEAFVEDGGHPYFIMKARCGRDGGYDTDPLTRRAQIGFGPILLKRKDSNLKEYIQKETDRLEKALSQVRASERAVLRLEELEREKEAACRALMLLTI